MKTSEKINEIAVAYIELQSDLKNVCKDKEGSTGKYTYRYLSFDKLLDETKHILIKHGFSVLQTACGDTGATVGITTRLIHKSGQWFEDTLYLPIPEMSGVNKAQESGAAITYARRYSYGAILGIATEEDTDGAVKKSKQHTSQTPKYTPETLELKFCEWLTAGGQANIINDVQIDQALDAFRKLPTMEAKEKYMNDKVAWLTSKGLK